MQANMLVTEICEFGVKYFPLPGGEWRVSGRGARDYYEVVSDEIFRQTIRQVAEYRERPSSLSPEKTRLDRRNQRGETPSRGLYA